MTRVPLLPTEFRLVDWILGRSKDAKYNLSNSGLPEPPLAELGVDTSFEAFSKEKDVHERVLAETVARIYRVEAKNVVVTSGASEAIFLAFSVLGKGSAVVPVPNYEPMLSVPRWLGMKVGHSLDGAVRPGAVYGLTDPNNPTGARLGSAALDRLGQISKKAPVFVNETYGGFAFEEPATLHSRLDDVVTCSSMTKFYGLGRLRVGWMIADAKRAGLLRRGKKLLSGHDSEYSLWLARQVLEKRGPFVERARRTYEENLAAVRRFARRGLGVSAELSGAAPFRLFRYEGGPNSVSFAKALLAHRSVLVGPGDFFGAPRSFRLCFTSPRDELEAGLEELAAFLGDRR